MRTFQMACVLFSILLSLSCAPTKIPKTVTAEQKTSAWPYYRKELSAVGMVTNSSFNGKLDIIWEDRTGGKPCGPLTLYKNMLVVPNTKGKLLFYNAEIGGMSAAVKTSGTPQTGAIITDSQIVFAVAPPKNILRSLRLSDNKLLWKKAVKDATAGSILVKNNLICSSGEGVVTAFDLNNGTAKWTFKTDGRCTAPPAFQNGTVIQPADNSVVYGLSAETGMKLFETTTQAPVVSNVIAMDDLFCVDITGTAYRLDAVSGAIKWSVPTGETVWASPDTDGKNVYIAASSGSIIALDAVSGTMRWTCTVTEVCKSSPLVVGDVVVAGTMTGRLFSINAANGEVIDQRQLLGAISASPIADEHHVYVATDKGYIHCFGNRNENASANNR